MSIASTETHEQQKKIGKIESQKQTIEAYLIHTDGMTSAHLSETLGMVYSTFCARLSELVDEGKVYYNGSVKEYDKTNSKIYFEHDIFLQKQRAGYIHYSKFVKTLKRLRTFEEFLPVDVVIFIDTELN